MLSSCFARSHSCLFQDAVCVVPAAVAAWSRVGAIGSVLRASLGAEVSVPMLARGGRDRHGL
jgi:hypothetical protein